MATSRVSPEGALRLAEKRPLTASKNHAQAPDFTPPEILIVI